MSKVEDRARWTDGETLNVPAVNAELRSLVGEMNGRLDRDNCPGITETKFVLETFNTIRAVFGSSATVFAQTPQGFEGILSLDIECEDGRLQVEGVAVAESNGSAASAVFWALAIAVDGRIVARSPPSDDQFRTTLRAVASAPVPPGTRRVVLGIIGRPGDAINQGDTVEVGHHLLWARSVVR